MIKALMLIFLPRPTWEQIAALRRSTGYIFLIQLLPLLLLTALAQGYGLVHWGTPRGDGSLLTKFSVGYAFVFEAVRVLVSLAVVFVMVTMIKALGQTFHGRHSFHQIFTLVAYGLSPLFLVRVLLVFPVISPWLIWAVGVSLSAGALYSGIPTIMKPDPPHALGLYLMSCLFLFLVTGLVCLVAWMFLKGKLLKLDEALSSLAAHLPF